MATDATLTPTSPDLIPKYNTSVDSPSGNGFNAAMDTIQSIITQLKAGTLASGKLLASALSGIVPTANLGSGSANSTTVLRGDQTWAVPSMIMLDDLTVSGSVLASYDTNTRLGGNLPTTYKDIILVITGRSDQTGDQVLNLRINNDSTANYYYQRFVSNNAQAISNEGLAQTSYFGGAIPRNGGFFGNNTITFYNYAGTVNAVADGGYSVETTYMTTAATNGLVKYWAGGGHAAINTTTRIAVTPAVGSFQLGCRFTLYGRS